MMKLKMLLAFVLVAGLGCMAQVSARVAQRRVGSPVSSSYKARLERIQRSGGFNARSGTRGGEFAAREGVHPQELELMVLQGKALDEDQQAQLDQFHADNPGIAEQFSEAMIAEGFGVAEEESEEDEEAGTSTETSDTTTTSEESTKLETGVAVAGKEFAGIVDQEVLAGYREELNRMAQAVKNAEIATSDIDFSRNTKPFVAKAMEEIEASIRSGKADDETLDAITEAAFAKMIEESKASNDAIRAELVKLEAPAVEEIKEAVVPTLQDQIKAAEKALAEAAPADKAKLQQELDNLKVQLALVQGAKGFKAAVAARAQAAKALVFNRYTLGALGLVAVGGTVYHYTKGGATLASDYAAVKDYASMAGTCVKSIPSKGMSAIKTGYGYGAGAASWLGGKCTSLYGFGKAIFSKKVEEVVAPTEENARALGQTLGKLADLHAGLGMGTAFWN